MSVNRRLLVTGGSGLVGRYFLAMLANKFQMEVYATSHNNRPSFRTNFVNIDLAQSHCVPILLERLAPSVIVNLAAYTDVDGCETNVSLARSLNSELVKLIASYIENNDQTYLLHISTDYVFDGIEGNYYEDSNPNPINVYGRTKLDGETEITRGLGDSRWCIARISTPFGFHHKKQSFPLYIINTLKNGGIAKVVSDQYTSPTYAMSLATMLIEIIAKKITGLIHISGSSRVSRYEQALMIAEVFGLHLDNIVKAHVSDMSWKAKRPKDSSLNVDKASQILDNKPERFDTAIRKLKNELNSKKD
jgi:dTDP-4-dehydrorhamnose reductase